jgi:8-hydroxy-5-deazaflavin:NADPH oxidoreductase
MNIVIVGAGNVGRALGQGWMRAGHRVTFAVRDVAKPDLAQLRAAGAQVVTIAGAGSAGDVIVLTVPWQAVNTSIAALGSLAGKILIDATNPLTPGYDLAVGHDDSAGETVARLARDARVVKAFNTTGFGNMADSQYTMGKLAMLVAGDDAEAKRVVLGLASDLGFDPVDAGPLTISRYLEPMAMVWIKLAMAQKMGRDFGFAILRR